MEADLLFTTVLNLALGTTLLLAWFEDRSQGFSRWLGLSFLLSAVWLPGYPALFDGAPQWPLASGLLWAVQISLCLACLALGVAELSGWTRVRRPLFALAALLAALEIGALFLSPRLAALLPALAMLAIGAAAARYLWRGPFPERVAAALLLVHGLAWLLYPLGGPMLLATQSLLVAITRLLLGLALLTTCLQRAARAAQQASQQLTRLIEGAHQGVLVVQGERVMYVNAQLLRILGLRSAAEMDEEWRRWRASDARALILQDALPRLFHGEVDSIDFGQPWERRDGSRLQLKISAWLVEWQGQPASQIVISDETASHNTAQRLIYQATHDSLTGLPNGLHVRDLLQAQAPLALLLIDIDNFRSINDSLGLQAGDAFLQLAAARIANGADHGATLARLAADEFLLVLPGARAQAEVAAAAERVLVCMRQPFRLQELSVASSVTIGIARAPHDGADYDTLLAHANLAARAAKQAGRNTLRFYEERMQAHLREDLELTHELHAALAGGQLQLYYQPIFDGHSGRVAGAEALLRWCHPQRGMVPPARFIPLAERSGQIVDIGRWVIQETCARLAAWQTDPALAPLVLSSNVSAVQCARGDLDQLVQAMIARSGAPAAQIELEITESALIHDPDEFIALLQRLKALGVRIAIDDFGTGYSNLAYLQRFSVDKLKIDQSFVQRVHENVQDTAIVRAIIQLAKSLSLHTTAEGIEDSATGDALVALGCDQLQGYLFSRPLPLAQFEALVRDAHRAVHPAC
ncbi:bifunctional diguanylate cyclase/phosphodiesterase [Massilia sp. TS11]|uniref:putative bifunctional diguanylate cyclase/phosphodiesterase n=1 Tax=Massilia sp. TS11 TaxID=2908003 RepID=UPI001EDC51E7|nr:bifunctional diguanylate cyclase/phosphodiesterase [Massilia sp. TS11]MCG2586092.1 bifunctional diguanylate cyclase/phosphodiesterase [Massilia sp. TS11]